MSLTKGTCCLADDFNRVILSMKRGQEYTDYINASFIDVSPVALAAPCGGGPLLTDPQSARRHNQKGWTCLQRSKLFH